VLSGFVPVERRSQEDARDTRRLTRDALDDGFLPRGATDRVRKYRHGSFV
jgi:hypothetical protein